MMRKLIKYSKQTCQVMKLIIYFFKALETFKCQWLASLAVSALNPRLFASLLVFDDDSLTNLHIVKIIELKLL